MPQAVPARHLATKTCVLTQISVGFVVEKRHWVRSPPMYFGPPCATSRKDEYSIPDVVVGIFHGLILPAAVWSWVRVSL